jgi:hypothetical protein
MSSIPLRHTQQQNNSTTPLRNYLGNTLKNLKRKLRKKLEMHTMKKFRYKKFWIMVLKL